MQQKTPNTSISNNVLSGETTEIKYHTIANGFHIVKENLQYEQNGSAQNGFTLMQDTQLYRNIGRALW